MTDVLTAATSAPVPGTGIAALMTTAACGLALALRVLGGTRRLPLPGWAIRHAQTGSPRPARDEQSNSVALFILVLPLVLGVFGIGLDVARNVYIKSTAQNALDAATYAVAGLAELDGSGQARITDLSAADQTFAEVYALNREQGPALQCQGEGAIPGSTIRKCWVQPTPLVVTSDSVTATVQERSRNAFLQLLGPGLAYQDYTLTSHAYLNLPDPSGRIN